MRTGPENYAFRNRQTYDAHIKTQLDAASINIVRAKPKRKKSSPDTSLPD